MKCSIPTATISLSLLSTQAPRMFTELFKRILASFDLFCVVAGLLLLP
jgi:hypothetical protein